MASPPIGNNAFIQLCPDPRLSYSEADINSDNFSVLLEKNLEFALSGLSCANFTDEIKKGINADMLSKIDCFSKGILMDTKKDFLDTSAMSRSEKRIYECTEFSNYNDDELYNALQEAIDLLSDKASTNGDTEILIKHTQLNALVGNVIKEAKSEDRYAKYKASFPSYCCIDFTPIGTIRKDGTKIIRLTDNATQITGLCSSFDTGGNCVPIGNEIMTEHKSVITMKEDLSLCIINYAISILKSVLRPLDDIVLHIRKEKDTAENKFVLGIRKTSGSKVINIEIKTGSDGFFTIDKLTKAINRNPKDSGDTATCNFIDKLYNEINGLFKSPDAGYSEKKIRNIVLCLLMCIKTAGDFVKMFVVYILHNYNILKKHITKGNIYFLTHDKSALNIALCLDIPCLGGTGSASNFKENGKSTRLFYWNSKSKWKGTNLKKKLISLGFNFIDSDTSDIAEQKVEALLDIEDALDNIVDDQCSPEQNEDIVMLTSDEGMVSKGGSGSPPKKRQRVRTATDKEQKAAQKAAQIAEENRKRAKSIEERGMFKISNDRNSTSPARFRDAASKVFSMIGEKPLSKTEQGDIDMVASRDRRRKERQDIFLIKLKSRYDRNILQNAINKDSYIKELKIINDWISKLTTYANDYSFTAEKRENSISFIKSLQDKRYELKANFTMFQAITSVLSKQIKDLKTLFMEHILSKNRGEKEIIIQQENEKKQLLVETYKKLFKDKDATTSFSPIPTELPTREDITRRAYINMRFARIKVVVPQDDSKKTISIRIVLSKCYIHYTQAYTTIEIPIDLDMSKEGKTEYLIFKNLLIGNENKNIEEEESVSIQNKLIELTKRFVNQILTKTREYCLAFENASSLITFARNNDVPVPIKTFQKKWFDTLYDIERFGSLSALPIKGQPVSSRPQKPVEKYKMRKQLRKGEKNCSPPDVELDKEDTQDNILTALQGKYMRLQNCLSIYKDLKLRYDEIQTQIEVVEELYKNTKKIDGNYTEEEIKSRMFICETLLILYNFLNNLTTTYKKKLEKLEKFRQYTFKIVCVDNDGETDYKKKVKSIVDRINNLISGWVREDNLNNEREKFDKLITKYENNKSTRDTNISECKEYILRQLDVVMKGGMYKKGAYYKPEKQVKDAVALVKPKKGVQPNEKKEKPKAKGVIRFPLF